MPTPRTRLAAGFAAWLAAVATALVVGLSAVGAIGTGLLGPSQQPLTPAEVDARLAATDPADLTAPDPTPVDPTPDEAATTPQVIATAGGRSSPMWRNAPAARARPRTGRVMASPEVPGREFRQRRHDIDDVFGRLDEILTLLRGRSG